MLTNRTTMRLLFIVQKFRQGWGGAPESVRLMANQLVEDGINADVYDGGKLIRDVGRLNLLPPPDQEHAPFDPATVRRYEALIQTGPWQRPASNIKTLIAMREARQKLFYLPRGGLGRAEFNRLRDSKKLPYFALVERGFLRAADGIILSSQIEARNSICPARRPAAEHIVPDFVNPLADTSITWVPGKPMTFSFLAEISPRKGLLPLIEAFISWVQREELSNSVRLIVGGAARPGSEGYLEQVKERCQAAPDVSIELRGAIPHHARTAFYGDTDVMVVSSHYESYGLTVIEALVQGCAVLAAPNIGALEVVGEKMPLSIAAGADKSALTDGLSQAYARFHARTEVDRIATRADAGHMVTAINHIARERWGALLA